MEDSKENSGKEKLKWYQKEVTKVTGLSSRTTEVKNKKWPFFAGIVAFLGIAAAADNYVIKSGVTESVISALRGEKKTAEVIYPVHTGTVDFATNKYFSMAEDDLEYVISDYNAKELKGKGQIIVSGNTAPGNPDLTLVEKITKPGDKKKTPALYTKVQAPDYSDATVADKMGYTWLRNLKFSDKTGWEKQPEAVRVFGRINTAENYIEILEKNKPVGKVIVSGINEYASFQLQQFGEENTYMFYLKRGETVQWSERQKTKELFIARVLGLDKLEIKQ
ncbi:hypothetical protein JW756_00450 [Candidatus Woesearchaeota archaeon]|nr:hypothetical protein [Candidatus Woesearchaeota archaeon]